MDELFHLAAGNAPGQDAVTMRRVFSEGIERAHDAGIDDPVAVAFTPQFANEHESREVGEQGCPGDMPVVGREM
jgi:hypothetical protein